MMYSKRQFPTGKSLDGGIIDNVYNEVITMAGSELEGKNVTRVQDGWSDIHNSPVFPTVKIGESSYFRNSIDT